MTRNGKEEGREKNVILEGSVWKFWLHYLHRPDSNKAQTCWNSLFSSGFKQCGKDLLLGLPVPLSSSPVLLLTSYVFCAFNGKLLSNQHGVTGLTRGCQSRAVPGQPGSPRSSSQHWHLHVIFPASPESLRSGGPDHNAQAVKKTQILLDLQLGEKQPQELGKELSTFIINIQLLIFNVIKPRLPPQPSHQTCRGHSSQNPLDRQFNVPVL